MARTYISYGLILFSALMVWEAFGILALVSSGYSWLPFSAFLASIIQFGVSSWLFLIFPKTGKLFSIAIALIMCVWPIRMTAYSFQTRDVIGSIYFLVVIGLCIGFIFNHIKTFKDPIRLKPSTRITLSIIPFGLFIFYVITTYKYF